MNVEDIPIPAMAAIRVSKEGKSALFETTIIQTTDNKYIYTMPVRVDNKLVNFETKGLLKEIKIEFAPFEFYVWKNISIVRFVEDGKSYLRIRTTTPGIKAMAWSEKPVTSTKKKKENLIREEALEMAKNKKYDIILLDIMLPKLTGLEVCQQIREFSDVPVIMLTAKGEDMDKILGLEYGADDYITKPFNILEVKARIKAIMRRTGSKVKEPAEKKAQVIEAGDLRLDCEGRRLHVSGREVNLTAKEFDVLELLVLNPNKVYGRENLLKLVWGEDYPGDVRTVDVHIRRLREKIEPNPSEPKYVHTKWGVGYYYK